MTWYYSCNYNVVKGRLKFLFSVGPMSWYTPMSPIPSGTRLKPGKKLMVNIGVGLNLHFGDEQSEVRTRLKSVLFKMTETFQVWAQVENQEALQVYNLIT